MGKKIKTFTVNALAGANIVTVAVMLATGYADHLSPAKLPLLEVMGMAFPLTLLLNLAFLVFWVVFAWRKVWIPIVGYALAYVPINIYMPLNPPRELQPDEGRVLKVVSYNVCGYGGNYKYKDGFERIVAYFDEQQPDIVCVQEDVDTWRHYALQAYQKVFAYNDTLTFNKTSAHYNCVGIHTRFPIVRRERIAYESKYNGSVAYYLDIGTDTLLVINNHLEATHLSAKERKSYQEMIKGQVGRDTMRTESANLAGKLSRAAVLRANQAEAVHDYIAQHSHYPTIVCGDLNDPPNSYTRRVVGQGLTDCFVEAGRGLGLSYNQKGFFFRIDHLFCSSHFEPLDCRVDSKIDFSDHYPLLCWLKFKDNY